MDKAIELNEAFEQLDLETKIWLIDLALLSPKPMSMRRVRYHNTHKDVTANPLQILKGVCKTLRVAPVDLKVRNNKRDLSDARYIAYSLLAQNGYNSVNIGFMFRRDHSSVIHGFDVHEALIDKNAKYIKKYEEVVSHINQNFGRMAS